MVISRSIRNSVYFLTLLVLLSVVPAERASAGTIGATSATPSSVSVGTATTVTVTSVITDPSLIPSSVVLQSLDSSGRVVALLGNLHDDGLNGDVAAGDGVFTLQTTIYQTAPGSVTLRVSAGFKGSLLRSFSSPMVVNITGTAIGINIVSPANLLYTNLTPVTVTGTVGDPNAQVNVNGINAPVGSGKFAVTVPLVEGLNTLTAVATNSNGLATSASVQVTLDTTPPHITVDSPGDGTTTTAAAVTVTGTANDVVVGTVNTQDVHVTVNGLAAQVANRTYSVLSVPLSLGQNTIQATGVDRAGNAVTASITVTRVLASQPPPPSIGKALITESLAIVSGNNQAGVIGTQLAAPLVVALTDAANNPLPNQTVVFKVTGSNGLLSAGGTSAPSAAVAVTTGANGQAQVSWVLGQRSGAGINIVHASSPLAIGSADFTATGLIANPAIIVVDSGNGQTGVLGQPLTFPFVADVVDAGHNRVPKIPVTFTVKQGGGNFAGGPSQTVTTDSNGRAIAVLTLGTQPGNSNNVAEANYPGNKGFPAAFAASALAPGNPSNTTISGLVLDNSNNPIQGVTVRLFQTNQGNNNNLPLQIGTPVQTNAKGTFLIQPAPVGFFKLMADGTTATSSGSFPTLEYDITTVAGADNNVGMPIYLPALDTTNKLCVDAAHGGTLTLPQVPGFSLSVLAGSATFPGGSRQGCVSVTPVNGDKVPMAPGFGQQPRFIVTIQPVGTTFNPPAPMTLPNVDGLPAKSVTEMYSYDHDLGMFIAIGTGTVSDDGSVIASNPGGGVLKAGWHCGGNPAANGTVADCPTCQICNGASCVADPSQNGTPITGDKCSQCQNGAPSPIPLDPTETSVSYTFQMPSSTIDDINEILKELLEIGIKAELKPASIGGTLTSKQCCAKDTGKSTTTKGLISAALGSFSFQGKIWPPGPIPSISIEIDAFGLAQLNASVTLLAGVFANLTAAVQGEVGYIQDGCAENDATRSGCVFADFTVPLTLGLSGQVGGSGEATYSCIICDTTKITIDGNFFFGNLAFPLNIAELKYNFNANNEPDCTAGFSGGTLQWQPATFKIGGDFSGSWQVNGGTTRIVKFSADILSCTIDLTSGIKCPPYF
jgi:hypothetical protein